MDTHAAIERLRTFIITQELPRTDMSLFGIRCPYCGKSDRIRELDAPENLGDALEPDHLDAYAELWRRLNPLSDALAVCKFCQNPLRLSADASGAEVLDAPRAAKTGVSSGQERTS